MEVYRCNFFEALKIINQDFGLELDSKYPKKIDKERQEVEVFDKGNEFKDIVSILTKDFSSSELKY